MATPARVAALKANGLPIPAPQTVRALIDTGASACVLDGLIIGRLGLAPTGSAFIHTPSTGASYISRNLYDASLILTDPSGGPRSFTVGVIESSLASEGFLAIVAWDVLCHCVLHFDGPARAFRVDF